MKSSMLPGAVHPTPPMLDVGPARPTTAASEAAFNPKVDYHLTAAERNGMRAASGGESTQQALLSKLFGMQDASRSAREAKLRKGGQVTYNMNLVAENYRDAVAKLAPGVRPSAVLKADAYGGDAGMFARTLVGAGCRDLFVATLDEAMTLRESIPDPEVRVYALHGPRPETEELFLQHQITPVLNSLSQVERWNDKANQENQQAQPRDTGAILQFDSGMKRAGLSGAELDTLTHHPAFLSQFPVRYVMSHLANADEPGAASNEAQLATFLGQRDRIRAQHPEAGASLAASAGVFLGPQFHLDMVRLGGLLQGMKPVPGKNPMHPVITAEGKIMQVRHLPAGVGAGYNLTGAADHPRRVALVEVGFVDGVARALSNKGSFSLGEHVLPIVGKVSMDTVMIDVTSAPEHLTGEGAALEYIGEHQLVDTVAQQAGTVPAAVTAQLGERWHREYVGPFGRIDRDPQGGNGSGRS